MVSPVFLSNPSPGLSPIAVFKGVLLAVSAIYVQKGVLLRTPKRILQGVLISMLLRVLVEMPVITCSVLGWLLRWVKVELELSPIVSFLVHDIMNLQMIASLLLHCYLIDSFEEIFLTGLKSLDSQTEDTYSSYLSTAKSLEIHSTVPMWLPDIAMTKSQTTSMIGLIRTHSMITLTTLLLNIIQHLTSKGYILVSIYTARSLNPLIGSQLTILSFLAGLMIPTDVMIQAYSQFQLMILTVRSLLTIPYFQKVRLTDVKVDEWMESRIGLISGFSLVFHFLLNKFDYMMFFILGVELLGLSFLIFKTTSPIPDPITDQWLLTQIYCQSIVDKLNVEDLTPGSILISEALKYNEPDQTPASKYATPAGSTTNLQKLT